MTSTRRLGNSSLMPTWALKRPACVITRKIARCARLVPNRSGSRYTAMRYSYGSVIRPISLHSHRSCVSGACRFRKSAHRLPRGRRSIRLGPPGSQPHPDPSRRWRSGPVPRGHCVLCCLAVTGGWSIKPRRYYNAVIRAEGANVNCVVECANQTGRERFIKRPGACGV